MDDKRRDDIEKRALEILERTAEIVNEAFALGFGGDEDSAKKVDALTDEMDELKEELAGLYDELS